MDNAQVTQPDIDAWEIYGPKIFNCEMTGPEALARHRLENADDEEETHKIGIDEGRQEMVREIDLATGGDGEFRYCMNGDPDRHCPDAEAMKARVLDRFAARHRLERSEPMGWMGIESAPKDGRGVLMIDMAATTPEASTAHFYEGKWWLLAEGDRSREGDDWAYNCPWYETPTHWMPLPSAPGTTHDQ